MRELHGLLEIQLGSFSNLKRYALMFDRLHLFQHPAQGGDEEPLVLDPEFVPEFDWLFDKGFLKVPRILRDRDLVASVLDDAVDLYKHINPRMRLQDFFDSEGREFFVDINLRRLAGQIKPVSGDDAIPICSAPLPASFRFQDQVEGSSPGHAFEVITITLEKFPTLTDDCAWEDIFDFKDECRNSEWALRRFLNAIANKKQTETEVRDDLDWSLNEYTKAMDRFKIKRSIGFMETYIIPTVEALEGFKPSSLLKGLVAIKKRKLELLEGEANRPGREVAYIYDAQKRFGQPNSR